MGFWFVVPESKILQYSRYHGSPAVIPSIVQTQSFATSDTVLVYKDSCLGVSLNLNERKRF